MTQTSHMPLRCSVLLADAEQRYIVKAALKDCGRALTFCTDIAESVVNANRFIDIYLMQRPTATEAQRAQLPAHGYKLELDYIPAINSADFGQWKADIRSRMDEIVQRHDPAGVGGQLSQVWLLAASAGGLKAVTEFLRRTGPSANMGLVYAQHIESNHVGQLVKMVRRHTSWQAEMAQESGFVKGGVVTIASPDNGIKLTRDGRITLGKPDAIDRYRPSIDGLCSELACNFPNACGMIAFSGMGDDGVRGSKSIKASGGRVWLQSPDSCEVSALPEAILQRGEFDHCAEIPVLAKKFDELSDRRLLGETRQ